MILSGQCKVYMHVNKVKFSVSKKCVIEGQLKWDEKEPQDFYGRRDWWKSKWMRKLAWTESLMKTQSL